MDADDWGDYNSSPCSSYRQAKNDIKIIFSTDFILMFCEHIQKLNVCETTCIAAETHTIATTVAVSRLINSQMLKHGSGVSDWITKTYSPPPFTF